MVYLALVEREDGSDVVVFPDCPGCATQVDPGESLQDVAGEALEGWLESALAHGEAPPRPSAAIETSDVARAVPVRIAPALAVRLQLRWARQELGVSQGELARRTGVTRQAIQQLESPDANLRLSTLTRVADALGLELDISLRAPTRLAVPA